jgi:EPS-associated MarR family transcriptional regulator
MENSENVGLEREEVLKVLRVIGENPQMTQRELSSRLRISLGKVNYLLQALISQGLVKVANFRLSNNKKAYLYYLTPRGGEEKIRTTYLFLKRKIEEYERLDAEIRQLKQELQETAESEIQNP